jgi:hypothetical protein
MNFYYILHYKGFQFRNISLERNEWSNSFQLLCYKEVFKKLALLSFGRRYLFLNVAHDDHQERMSLLILFPADRGNFHCVTLHYLQSIRYLRSTLSTL